MKIRKIAILAIIVPAAVIFAAAAYSGWGGLEPSKNMGNYCSFSYYSNTPGNAAVNWMQPGNGPVNPADEFWFDSSGTFNVPSGVKVPGTMLAGSGNIGGQFNLGNNCVTLNNLSQLAENANFAGTVYLTGPVTLTSNLTLTCDLRPFKGAVISTGNYALTLNGPFHAGLYQCFNVTGTGNVVISSTEKILPQWFGAIGTGDDTAVVQRAINVAATSHPGGTVLPLYFPSGVQYNFKLTSGGLNFKQVPVSCEEPTSFAGTTTVLNFTGTAGVAIRNAGYFANCEVNGGYVKGDVLSVPIYTMSSDANGIASVYSNGPNTLVVGATIHIDGATNLNGDYIVSNVTDTYHFQFHSGQPNVTVTSGIGTVYYYPTVGVAAEDQTASNSVTCSAVRWHSLYVRGFGTALDLSAFQNSNGSTDDWVIDGKTQITQALWGIVGFGNGLPLNTIGANVAAGTMNGTSQISCVARAFVGGPNTNVVNNADPEENSFGNNVISGIDAEAADTTSFPTAMSIVLTGAYGNTITKNYIAQGVDTSGGLGNIVDYNRISPTWISSKYDIGFGNTSSALNSPQWQGIPQRGGTTFNQIGTTSDPLQVQVMGGSGGTSHSYALVCVDGSGQQALPSTHFMCPDGSLVGSGGACAAGEGPTGYNPSTGNYVVVCARPDPACQKYYLLRDNANTVVTDSDPAPAGVNGDNCVYDFHGNTTTFNPVPTDQTGGINSNGPIKANLSLSIKDSGSCTMTSGACSAQTLSHTYASAPTCFAAWTGSGTLTGILKAPSTTTSCTPGSSVSTDTATVNWFCLGN